MASPKPLLILLTETYPFAGPDDAFLPPEVDYLRHHLDVRLVPTLAPGEPQVAREISPGVEVDLSLCRAIGAARGLAAVPRLCWDSRGFLPRGRDHSITPRLVLARRWARAEAARRWVLESLIPAIGDRPCVVYSWWGFAPAYGVAVGLAGTGIPMVVRVHGYDLYPEQDRLGFIPFQRELLECVDGMYSVSAAGADYLRSAYPELAERVHVAYLGVPGPSSPAPASSDGVFRLVTCSSAVPVKRLDRMVEAVSILREQGRAVEWTHLGGGPLLEELRERAAILGGCVRFTGQLPHDEVIPWLTSQCVDLFCNVSDSEGLPVSLMEAGACGIPLLARDVGGNGEIVDDTVGRLLPAGSEAREIAASVGEIMDLPPEVREGMRRASSQRWSERFQAEANYAAFAEMLMTRARGR